MIKKDKKLLSKSALVVADQAISSVFGLNIAWGLCKAYFGTGMELRQERVVEFVEMIKDNPSIFIEDILKDVNFQDGFVYTLEKYIKERSSKKRLILKNVFLGFSEANNKEIYPLEKMVHTSIQLSEMDIKVLGDVNVDKTDDKNYQIYGNTDRSFENIFNLIYLGLLSNDTGSRIGPVDTPFVKISEFGKKYVKYLSE